MSRKNSKNKNDKIIKRIKKDKPWHSSSYFAVIALGFLAAIDFAGFMQGGLSFVGALERAETYVKNLNYISMAVMLIGFTAAFEGATIYMAYAFSIKLYNYDKCALKRINNPQSVFSKFVSTSSLGWISFICFLLGVVANTIFRIGLYYFNISNTSENSLKKIGITADAFVTKERTLMIVMIVLPIVTSILNFVISCFSFDPLLFEMNNLSKKIAEIKSNNETIIYDLGRVDAKANEISNLRKTIDYNCTLKIARVVSLRPLLRGRFYEEQMEDEK